MLIVVYGYSNVKLANY